MRGTLVVALVFVAALLALTIYVTVRNGVDVLTAVSVLVLALLGFGIFGALRESHDA